VAKFARRAEKRIDVESARKERVTREEQERLEREQLKQELEEEERRKDRAKTVHKAQPIRYQRAAPVHGGSRKSAPPVPFQSDVELKEHV